MARLRPRRALSASPARATVRATVRATGRAAVACLATALAAAACATPGAADPLGLRAVATRPPQSVPTDAGVLTIWELEISHRAEGTVLLDRVDASEPDETLPPARLAMRLVPRVRAEPARRLLLGEGARTALLCRTFDAAAPGALSRSVVATGPNEHGFQVTASVTSESAPASEPPPRVLGAPLAGSRWLFANGPATFSGHRRAIVWIRRRPRAAQRFAADFFRVDARGATATGPRNEDHLAWGAPVLAVADAVVAAAVDGIPDNEPGPTERAVEMSHGTVAGNHVVLDLGDGAFAMFAHLRNGSVAVRAGDRVERGRVLGALGNSGNSTEPHLHFHVADGPSPVDADGLPWVLDAFGVEGGPAPGQRSGVLPAEASVVTFPEPRSDRPSTAAPHAPDTR